MDADTERDIVERLREDFPEQFKDEQPAQVIFEYEWERHEAAYEITRLRAQPSPREVVLREALIDAVAHLDAATSAYRKYAKRHASLGRADADPFYGARIKDFANAVERLRRVLASDGREG